MVSPKRGDIYWVNLDPTVGTEIRKTRPALVISNNAANERYHQVTVVPLTSQHLTQVELFQTLIKQEESGLNKDSKALAEQLRTISKRRLQKKLGSLNDDIMEKVARSIKIHLDLK